MLLTIQYLTQLLKDSFLKSFSFDFPDIYPVWDSPKDEQFGDLTTNIAMKSAKLLNRNPVDIAKILVSELKENDINNWIESIEIAGNGFINLKLNDKWQNSVLNRILNLKENYSKQQKVEKKKVVVEFVSANPTGPLHIGHGRQAVLGDVIANILHEVGYDVTREYYFNDAGRQMDLLGKSVWVRYQEIFGKEYDFPEEGYKGDYIKDIANKIFLEYNDKFLNKNDD